MNTRLPSATRLPPDAGSTVKWTIPLPSLALPPLATNPVLECPQLTPRLIELPLSDWLCLIYALNYLPCYSQEDSSHEACMCLGGNPGHIRSGVRLIMIVTLCVSMFSVPRPVLPCLQGTHVPVMPCHSFHATNYPSRGLW